MHLTIASFHARFNSPEPESFVAALRALPPLDDLRYDIPPPAQWGVWPSNEPREEGASLCTP